MNKNRGTNHRSGPTYQARSSSRPRCSALETNGSECSRSLLAQNHAFCPHHHRERNKLYAEYKTTQAKYEAQGDPNSSESIDKMKELVLLGRKVINLRDEVCRRFYSTGLQSNKGHIKQILRIKSEVDALDVSIASKELQSTKNEQTATNTEGGTGKQTLIFQSLLSPEIPFSKLDKLPRDNYVVVLRTIADSVREDQIRQIYDIFPSLNDSKKTVHIPGQGSERETDEFDLVIRYVFREYLLWVGNTEVLQRATKTATIDEFLRHSTGCEDYIKFLKALNDRRPDTSHFIRDAICDFLLPQDTPCLTILGGRVASDPGDRRMGVAGWDLLYQYFAYEDIWRYLEQYSTGFEDLLLVKKLSALHRYGDIGGEDPSWLHPENDVSQECEMALLLGFVAQTKGYCEPRKPVTYGDNGSITERQTREYLTGRMCKKDPMAKKLIEELASRLIRFMLIVYDRETGEIVVDTVDKNETWLTRVRTALAKDQLPHASWSTEWSVSDILNDLQLIRRIRDGMTPMDYYEFIIINRYERAKFDVLDCVADALRVLSGDLSSRDITAKAVRETFPSTEQAAMLEAIDYPKNRLLPYAPHLEYERNRSRAWDVLRAHPDIFNDPKNKSAWDLREARIVSRILASMEAADVIVKLDKFENPHGTPRLLKASDGQEDLYFDYSAFSAQVHKLDATANTSTYKVLHNTTLQLGGEDLRRFAQAFKATYPTAVFAKGTIHAHYCAWPFPHMNDIPVLAKLNFCTPEGHLYRWKQLPFDFPLAFQSWQYLLHCEINCKLSFARATQTTFIICAQTPAEAENNATELLAVAERKGWKLSFPMTHRWTDDLESLDAHVLWRGIEPLCMQSE